MFCGKHKPFFRNTLLFLMKDVRSFPQNTHINYIVENKLYATCKKAIVSMMV